MQVYGWQTVGFFEKPDGDSLRRILMYMIDLLARYRDGQRDFRGIDLRGARLQNADLCGIELSGADLRGAKFAGALLKEAKLGGVRCGALRRWVLLRGLLQLGGGILSGMLMLVSSMQMPHR